MNAGVEGETGLRGAVVPHVQDLSPALRLAADYVLKNPSVVAMRSLRQVAEISDLKPPTFTRLAQSLGFQNYEELRELCRQEVQQEGATFADKAMALQQRKSKGAGTFLPSHAAASVCNIENLVEATDLSSLAQAADLLAEARSVVLVGSLSSAALIDYFGYMAQMAFSNWRTALRNHETAAMALSDLGSRDVMLVVSHAPYAASAIEAAERAKSADVRVIAITDSYAAPVTASATYVFVTPTDGPHFFASAVPLFVLLEALLSMVVRRSGKRAQERIADIERGNHRSGEYWQS